MIINEQRLDDEVITSYRTRELGEPIHCATVCVWDDGDVYASFAEPGSPSRVRSYQSAADAHAAARAFITEAEQMKGKK